MVVAGVPWWRWWRWWWWENPAAAVALLCDLVPAFFVPSTPWRPSCQWLASATGARAIDWRVPGTLSHCRVSNCPPPRCVSFRRTPLAFRIPKVLPMARPKVLPGTATRNAESTWRNWPQRPGRRVGNTPIDGNLGGCWGCSCRCCCCPDCGCPDCGFFEKVWGHALLLPPTTTHLSRALRCGCWPG